ncbi:MAG TPA: IS4 family transposase [Gemmatimonadaceae bacterium]
MMGDELREHLGETLDSIAIGALAEKYGIQERERKLNVLELVVALILAGGTHEGGRQYDVLRTYVANGAAAVVRGTFYAWFTEPLVKLLAELLDRAIAVGRRQAKLLPGILAGVADWHVVDSTTVRLDKALIDTFPGAGEYAALKIHKEWSVGTGNLVGYKITPAREHDSPHLVIDESRRGTGLLMDLGYASIDRLAECEEYDVRYVIRLKENWKPTVDRLVRGAVFPEAVEGGDFDALLEQEVIVLDGHAIDADVTIGRGVLKVRCRLVGIPTPKGYCFFLTNLSRKTHGPHQVGEIYRVRWEIEIDNKVEKAGARLDEIAARRPVSARILVLATLLNATIARTIVQSEKLAIVGAKKIPTEPAARAPLHPILLMRALAAAHGPITRLLQDDTSEPMEWRKLMSRLRDLGSDPNWRRRPSVLDRIQGLTAPPIVRRARRVAA